MGFNATVVVNLDLIHIIERNIDFAQRFHMCVVECANSNRSVDMPEGLMIVEAHHSSLLVPVFVGGNIGHAVTAGTVGVDVNNGLAILQSIRGIADSLGYKLIRKPKDK